jgi:hypothetical protein
MVESMFAASIASGRKPSKLTINTRSIFGKGSGVDVGGRVWVGGASEGLGVRVAVGMTGAGVGASEAEGWQACRRIVKRVKNLKCFVMVGNQVLQG